MNPFHTENLRAQEYAVTDGGAGETLYFDDGRTLRVTQDPTSTDQNNVPGGVNNDNRTTFMAVPADCLAINLKQSDNFTYIPTPGVLVRMKIAGPIVKTPSFWQIRGESLLKVSSPATGTPGL